MLKSRKRTAQQVAGVGGKRRRIAKPAPMYRHRRNMLLKGDQSRHKPWAALGAWFMGPKAENGDVFHDLVTQTIDSQIKFRRHVWVFFFLIRTIFSSYKKNQSTPKGMINLIRLMFIHLLKENIKAFSRGNRTHILMSLFYNCTNNRSQKEVSAWFSKYHMFFMFLPWSLNRPLVTHTRAYRSVCSPLKRGGDLNTHPRYSHTFKKVCCIVTEDELN